eukprot:CAMPEP_0174750742 /NCGR_PEP_ID=MMETSP1094-20130205/98389_1 /TAXON_ID=156173 /ORGANISM="Chrysochromulina brevifilum, Strain UTEX LB 985" /LENGTH=61 /DNA_ID=CAMNT_0015956135 /DNA_START=71 /DNA_END=252 /DNA_ORIENTATION=-
MTGCSFSAASTAKGSSVTSTPLCSTAEVSRPDPPTACIITVRLLRHIRSSKDMCSTSIAPL